MYTLFHNCQIRHKIPIDYLGIQYSQNYLYVDRSQKPERCHPVRYSLESGITGVIESKDGGQAPISELEWFHSQSLTQSEYRDTGMNMLNHPRRLLDGKRRVFKIC